MKILSSALLALTLFGSASAMAAPAPATAKTPKLAARAELKIAYPKTKFGPVTLGQTGIANRLTFSALTKVKMGQMPMQARGVVSAHVGGWTASMAPAGNTGITGGIPGINNQVP